MLAQFTIFPVGKRESLSKDVAKILDIIDKSGLPYRFTPMATIVEGSWDQVMALIKKCHEAVLGKGERVVTSIKIDDRKGHQKMIDTKVLSIEKRLRKPVNK